MKKIIHLYPLLGLTLCLTVLACRKSITKVPTPPTDPTPVDTTTKPIVKPDSVVTQSPPFPQTPVTGCSYAPNYGDTIIYPQPTTGQDYIVSPVNNPGPGKYLSWPIGLVIDSVTGAIDVTKSETGMKYAIGFIKAGTTDTCLNDLIIGGAAYMDSVYVLADGATQAVPYFDANPNLLSVCATGNGCTFDVTGSAASHKVIVNSATGIIDLQKTLNGGLLGGAFGLLPVNGSSFTIPIYYRLNDPSNNALQHIDVQLAYYSKKSLIDLSLLNGLLNKLNNILTGNLISTTSNPRPPLIIIVRSK
ncbi:MAG TPA: hypothetical protein VL832_18630 [Puia sp.]|nr:hypothetical protein [Puia sp.]